MLSKRVVFFLLICFGAFVRPGFASVYSYITKSTGSPTNATYEYTIESWDYSSTLANPCFGVKTCQLGVSHRHDANGKGNGLRDVLLASSSAISNVKTIGELGRIYNAKFPFPKSGTLVHNGPAVTAECVGIFYLRSGAGGEKPTLLPGSICGVAPPPGGICGIDEQIIDIEHGTLRPQELNGHSAERSITVRCSVYTSLKMYVAASNGGRVDLDRKMHSDLSVAGVSGGDGYLFSAGPGGVSIPIKSTLSVIGDIDAGIYQGSAVAVLSVP